tara:strand:+ start:318 stop:1625 length:1308 start_codon:yes stop_codon:yes gene_type:complete
VNSFKLFILLIGFVFTQESAREISLGGSMVTLSRGISSIGVNPANLAFSKSTFNLINFNTSIYNNLFSIQVYNNINGTDLENPNSLLTKTELIEIIDGDSFDLSHNFNLYIPGINFSNSSYAITTKLNQIIAFKAGNGLLKTLFFGNEWETEVPISLEIQSHTIVEYGYSSSYNIEGFALGYTLKYLQGVNLLNLYTTEDSEPLYTDSNGIDVGLIFAREIYPGGSGFGVDIGFLTKQPINGYSIGLSVTNLFGYINWDKKNLNYTLFGRNIADNMNLNTYQTEFIGFRINNLNATDLMSDAEEFADSVVSDTSFIDSNDYLVKRTDYPSVLRFGLSKIILDNLNLAYESRTRLQSLGSSKANWIHSLGLEVIRWKLFPIRFGVSSGDKLNHKFSFGGGIHLNPFELDLGISWIGSRKLYTANGFELGFTLTFIY